MTEAASGQSVNILRGKRLAPTQRSLLAAQMRQPESPAMNMACLVRFDEEIDPERFAAAFDAVVMASDVLRMQIDPAEPGNARIAGAPTSQTIVERIAESDVDRWSRPLIETPLDLQSSCYRSALALQPGATTWLLNVHHIATDAAGSSLIIEQTLAAYRGEVPAKNDYFGWVRQATGEPRAAKATESWFARVEPEHLGQLYTTPAKPSGQAERVPVSLSTTTQIAIQSALEGPFRLLTPDLSRTTFLVLVVACHLHRISGSSHFTIGIPVHHRSDEASRSLLGPTLGLYPVDVVVEEGDTYLELHRRISRALMQALKSAHPGATAPGDFDAVVNSLPEGIWQDLGGSHIDTTWVHSAAIDVEHVLRVQALTRQVEADSGSSGAALTLHLDVPVETGLESGHAPRAAEHFANMVNAIVASPQAPLGSATVVSQDELDQIVRAERSPALPAPVESLPVRLRSALEGTSHVVLSSQDDQLTGRELWEWVCQVGHHIEQVTDPGDRVAIEFPRSVEAVVAIYAVVVSGRSFVPIDPDSPQSRRRSLRLRAGVALAFTSAEEIAELRNAPATAYEPPQVGGSSEAYLLYTSGSTGEPKGVSITHQAIADYVAFAKSSYFNQPGAVVAALFTALTFDLTLTTIFAPLLAGGTVVVFEDSGPVVLAKLAADSRITWCKATPSHLDILLTLIDQDHGLNTFVVGGEAFTGALARRIFEYKPTAAVFNEYGPTEAVVGCMIHRASADEADTLAGVPIGTPAPGVELRVVDRYDRRVPLNTSGELLIAHPGLMAQYLGVELEDETDSSPFVELDGTRFYRSGDLVSRADDLLLTYRGRIDEQVKVGGIRLDPIEVEQALANHPSIQQAAVRLWSPSSASAQTFCARCGLPDNVPGVEYDQDQICDSCRGFDVVEPMAQAWFRSEADLVAQLPDLREAATGDYDCVHLLSGGKDSTYALYRLVEMGFRPYTLTLDNGFISEGAKENARAVANHLGLEHEFLTTPAMNEIFADSLANYSDVCHGCYKTIYILATNRAVELGVPVVITGLSRGQLFETRLIPGQFQAERFDPAAIDAAVIEARKRYHRAPDFVNRVLDTDNFEDDGLFERLQYIDFYRFVDVQLSEVLEYLEEKTPWRRPLDTGRSSNCLINVAGIHAHQVERGYHNYAEPYAWDVRLGHKTRDEAMAELDDPIVASEVAEMLNAVGYEPAPRQTLTAWYTLAAGESRTPTPTELRSFLAERIPRHAIPSAFVMVDAMATNRNGKLDVARMPRPVQQHRPRVAAALGPQSEMERVIIDRWQRTLGIEPIGTDDDFFALGGDSLSAVTMIIELSEALATRLPEELAFVHTTPGELARALQAAVEASASTPDPRAHAGSESPTDSSPTPPLSPGESSLLFEQRSRPEATMYNVGRKFTVAGSFDHDRFVDAVRAAAARHEPLRLTFSQPRLELESSQAVEIVRWDQTYEPDQAQQLLAAFHREPLDPTAGPLLRCAIAPLTNGTIALALVMHHVSGDHQSLDVLWHDIDQLYRGRPLPSLPFGYGALWQWQSEPGRADASAQFWADHNYGDAPQFPVPHAVEPDGFLTAKASIVPDRLRRLASQTPVAAAVAAAGASVRRFFSDDRPEVCLVASTRTHPGAQGLCGYLLNPLPIRLDCAADIAVRELAAAASVSVGRAMPHRAYPFSNMVADARRGHRSVPSGNILVSYSDDPAVELGGLPVEQEMLFNGSAVADLSFFVDIRDDAVEVGVEYSGATVGAQVAASVLNSFEIMLTAIVDQATTPLGGYGLHAVNPSVLRGAALADHESLLEKCLGHMAARPDEAAVESGGQSLTWAQLGARANQLARHLQAVGVQRGDYVLVNQDRTIHLLVSVLGVLLCGATYVPIDPRHPRDRSRAAADAVGARFELASPSCPALADVHITVDDTGLDNTPWGDTMDLPVMNRATADLPGGDDTAYVIFTSGSTGTPNGVPISHAQLAASTNARAQFYQQAPSRFIMVSSVAFDSSIVGLFWSLAEGATLVLPSEDVVHDVDSLVELFESETTSHALCVPSLYAALLARRNPVGQWIQHMIVAGEACPPQLVESHFQAVPATRLTNEYGPSEATVWATAHHCVADDADVSIGTPIPGAWCAVVDTTSAIRDVGLVGELVIGGAGVASGYLGESKSPRFDDARSILGLPADLTGPIFRTGDRVIQTNSSLHFMGRVDNQLNIGGARVEPEEIEAVLATIPGVQEAVVVAVDIRSIDEMIAASEPDALRAALKLAAGATNPAPTLRTELGGTAQTSVRLVAHLVANNVGISAVREHVMESLPRAHRPSRFVFHDDLPRSPTGKLDRDAAMALPIPASSGVQGPNQRNPGDVSSAVAQIAGLYAEVLGTDSVGDEDSFFDLGGDSLLAVELLTRLETKYRRRLATQSVHRAPTPRELAALLGDQIDGGDDHERLLVLPIQPLGTRPPMYFVHHIGVNGKYVRPLSKRLGSDQPVTAIADPAAITNAFQINDQFEQGIDIAETAREYCDEIVSLTPAGPFVLLGFCQGGVLAHEVASQLAQRGRTAALVVTVGDWHAPNLQFERESLWNRFESRRALHGVGRIRHVLNIAKRGTVQRKLIRHGERLAVRATAKLPGRLSGKLPGDLSTRLHRRRAAEETVQAFESYTYRPYSGRVLIVRGADHPETPEALGNSGWDGVLQDLRVEYIPGLSLGLLSEPEVGALADLVTSELDEILRASTKPTGP